MLKRSKTLPFQGGSRGPQRASLSLAALLLPATLLAAGLPGTQEVTVVGSRSGAAAAADASSDGTITAEQLAHRPLLRPAETLEAVPGLVVTQHSGDGKANQYFLRGFNLDHGSDFATRLLGMPINVASHAHGQGYTDLNFLLPELVRTIRYRKGPYAAEDGDFAVTGAAHIDLVRRVEQPFVAGEVGGEGFRRLLAAGSREAGGLQWLGAAQFMRNDGPWEQPEGLRKSTLLLRVSQGEVNDGIAVTLLAYRATWTATEHVPQRAIESGEIGRYGALLAGDGGVTHRHSLSLEWARGDDGGRSRAEAWWIGYGLNLFSAPSGFIEGPQGDQHEQEDRRRVVGGRLARQQALPFGDGEVELGLQWRRDDAPMLALYDTVQRVRTATVRADRLRLDQQGLYAEWRQPWTRRLRTSAGLRLDRVRADVATLGGVFDAGNGGGVAARQVSPKLSLALGPFGGTELYANFGRGFHSNDARGATTRINPRDGSAVDPVPLLVPARGGELGARFAPLPGWNSALTLWWLRLGSELVFVGDEGVTEPRGASRRGGIEWANYVVPAPGWLLDVDVAGSRARFMLPDPDSGGRQVPNAIPFTASVGLVHDDGGAWSGGLRLRHLGRYALEPSGAERSSPSTVVNLDLGWRAGPALRVGLQLLNLTGGRANDIEYWGGACTRREGAACSAAGGYDGRLVHPLEPRTLRLNARLSF